MGIIHRFIASFCSKCVKYTSFSLKSLDFQDFLMILHPSFWARNRQKLAVLGQFLAIFARNPSFSGRNVCFSGYFCRFLDIFAGYASTNFLENELFLDIFRSFLANLSNKLLKFRQNELFFLQNEPILAHFCGPTSMNFW